MSDPSSDFARAQAIVDRRYNAVSYRLVVRVPSTDGATRFPLVDPLGCFLYLVPADHPSFFNIDGYSYGAWFDTLEEDARKRCIYLGDLSSAWDKVGAFRLASWDSHCVDRELLNAVRPADTLSADS